MKTKYPFIFLALLCCANAHAQLYKWISEDGKVNYSNTPPPATAKRVETKTIGAGSTSDFPPDLAEATKTSPITFYSASDCRPCDEARMFLKNRGIPFSERTINTGEDAQKLREATGKEHLPAMVVGRTSQTGYESGAWGQALTTAGYPEVSKLPKSYQYPQAQPLTPIAPSVATSDKPGTRSIDSANPPTGNAPPGFRF